MSVVQRMLAICFALSFFAFANLIVADEIPDALYHGHPDNGKVENGHYFVGDRGRYTEVSERFYYGMLWYSHLSLEIGCSSFFISVGGIWLYKRRAKMASRISN